MIWKTIRFNCFSGHVGTSWHQGECVDMPQGKPRLAVMGTVEVGPSEDGWEGERKKGGF